MKRPASPTLPNPHLDLDPQDDAPTALELQQVERQRKRARIEQERNTRRREQLRASDARAAVLRHVTLPLWMRTPLPTVSPHPRPLKHCKPFLPRPIRKALASSSCSAATGTSTPINALFPVQVDVLTALAPQIAARVPLDLALAAPTGSGKTLAYVLPILLHLMTVGVWPLRLQALIVVPTRDLANQVWGVLQPLCQALGIRSGALTAAKHAPPGAGVSVLVATPGRLVDAITSHQLASSSGVGFGCGFGDLEMVVLDEADKLLAQDFDDFLTHLHHVTSTSSAGYVRRIVCSATLTRNPGKIAALRLTNPRYYSGSAAPQSAQRYVLPPTLAEHYVVVGESHKPHLLLHLLFASPSSSSLSTSTKDSGAWSGLLTRTTAVVVFASAKDTAHRLTRFLQFYVSSSSSSSSSSSAHECGVTASQIAEYSSLMPHDVRAEQLRQLASGGVRIVVCSDALSRGLDVASVDAVVAYDVPAHIKTYVHRAGRTARAGRAGVAVSMLRPEEVRWFKDMARKAVRTTPLSELRETWAVDASRVEAALEHTAAVLQDERQRKVNPTMPLPQRL
jgi:ATP-dependent RNA helicase DDX51/DBP6